MMVYIWLYRKLSDFTPYILVWFLVGLKLKIRLSQILLFHCLKYYDKNCTIIQQLSIVLQQSITSTYTLYIHDLFMTFSAVLHRKHNSIIT